MQLWRCCTAMQNAANSYLQAQPPASRCVTLLLSPHERTRTHALYVIIVAKRASCQYFHNSMLWGDSRIGQTPQCKQGLSRIDRYCMCDSALNCWKSDLWVCLSRRRLALPLAACCSHWRKPRRTGRARLPGAASCAPPLLSSHWLSCTPGSNLTWAHLPAKKLHVAIANSLPPCLDLIFCEFQKTAVGDHAGGSMVCCPSKGWQTWRTRSGLSSSPSLWLCLWRPGCLVPSSIRHTNGSSR